MKYSVKMTDLSAFKNNWPWMLGWGIGLIILGLLAISFATFTSLLSVVVLGGLILVGGLFVIIDSLHFWRGRSGFAVHLLIGILYTVVGLALIFGPVMGAVTLTLLLACMFILVGLSRIISAISLKLPTWKWGLASGMITLLLGILILTEWPASGLFIIGLFIGIDLVLFGWATVMVALFARNS
jgi:uncharacterized membrane protein HdeD (DUF308 family)